MNTNRKKNKLYKEWKQHKKCGLYFYTNMNINIFKNI